MMQKAENFFSGLKNFDPLSRYLREFYDSAKPHLRPNWKNIIYKNDVSQYFARPPIEYVSLFVWLSLTNYNHSITVISWFFVHIEWEISYRDFQPS